ncbi:Glycosyl transferases group 1 [uncultured archaeon]|nr:Glycosyl transferases group 1 [uncultured archaeon]
MRIAVLNPCVWLGKNSLHPYIGEFILRYKPLLYFNEPKFFAAFLARFSQAYGLPALLGQLPRVRFGEGALRAQADVLLCFNGASESPLGRPPQSFGGLKVFHLMDYFSHSGPRCAALQAGGVDYVMGYADHGKYDAFFRQYYAPYVGKVIPVPFSFGARFSNRTPFDKRFNKCIALGAVGPFVDEEALHSGKVKPENLSYEARDFFAGEPYLHKFRSMLRAHEQELHDILDSMLAGAKVENLYTPDQTLQDQSWVPKGSSARKMAGKNWNYNIPDVLNQYRMYTQCETLFNIPLGKVYEGTACGCALVCSDAPCFHDLGFEDGVNCLMHKPYDLASFRKRVQWGLDHPAELGQIAAAGEKLVRENYNAEKVAQRIYDSVLEIYNQRQSGQEKKKN